jgi:hypothetical protein
MPSDKVARGCVDVEAGFRAEVSAGIGDDVQHGGQAISLSGISQPARGGDGQNGGEKIARIVLALRERVGLKSLEGERYERIEALLVAERRFSIDEETHLVRSFAYESF